MKRIALLITSSLLAVASTAQADYYLDLVPRDDGPIRHGGLVTVDLVLRIDAGESVSITGTHVRWDASGSPTLTLVEVTQPQFIFLDGFLMSTLGFGGQVPLDSAPGAFGISSLFNQGTLAPFSLGVDASAVVGTLTWQWTGEASSTLVEVTPCRVYGEGGWPVSCGAIGDGDFQEVEEDRVHRGVLVLERHVCEDDDCEPPPAQVFLSGEPASITTREVSVLTWWAIGASDCEAGGDWAGQLTPSGSVALRLSSSARYVLTCIDDETGLPVEAETEIAFAVPPGAAITSNHAFVVPGSPGRLQWSSERAVGCSLGGSGLDPGQLAPAGTMPLPAGHRGWFEIICNADASAELAVAAIVVGLDADSLAYSIVPDRLTANPGEAVTLTVQSRNAARCRLAEVRVAEAFHPFVEQTISTRTAGVFDHVPGSDHLWYEFRCDGGPTARATIGVRPDSYVALEGEERADGAMLRWHSRDTIDCRAHGNWSGERLSSGEETVSAAPDSRWEIECRSRRGGTVSAALAASQITPTPEPSHAALAALVAIGALRSLRADARRRRGTRAAP